MRIYRQYRCDFGHTWTDVAKPGDPEMGLCPEGHPVVTCSEETPADEVQILLRPMTRIINRVTSQTTDAGRFQLVLLDRNDNEILVSTKTYSWNEVVQLAGRFVGKSEEEATRWWNRKIP